MHIYNLCTYSHEEHAELFVTSAARLTQQELCEKFRRIMLTVAQRREALHQTKKRRNAFTYAELFNDISTADLLQEGFFRVVPTLRATVNAWSNSAGRFKTPDSLTDITFKLTEELREKNLRMLGDEEVFTYGEYAEDLEHYEEVNDKTP